MQSSIAGQLGACQLAEASFEGTIVPSRTAIIITDIWDKHWCCGATERAGEIANRMEAVLERARKAGILIIHAPSDTMDFYAHTSGRLLAENAPKIKPPKALTITDGPLPIDDSNGGCDTNDTYSQAWTRENPKLKIAPGDVISDDGNEIYNVLCQLRVPRRAHSNSRRKLNTAACRHAARPVAQQHPRSQAAARP